MDGETHNPEHVTLAQTSSHDGSAFQKERLQGPRQDSRSYLRAIKNELDMPPERASALNKSDLISEMEQSREEFRRFEENQGEGLGIKSFVGIPWEFSFTPISELEPVLLAEMQVRETYNGYYLLCRVIARPCRDVEVYMGVEDRMGDVARVHIFNYPTMHDATLEDLDALFPLGSILLIREPSYKYNILKGYKPYIHVYSPTDITMIDQDQPIARELARSNALESIPCMLRATADEWRVRGASEFKAGRWLAAAVCYSRGLRLDNRSQVLRLNRAETYLRLGWYFSALHDVEWAQHLGTFADTNLAKKSIFRSIRANYGLCRYDRVVQIAQECSRLLDCNDWLEKARDRMREQSGNYDWFSLFKDEEKPNMRLEAASYQGPVIVRDRDEQPGNRGVFVTRDVQVGELLFVATPLTSAYPDETTCKNEDFDVYNYVMFTRGSLAQSLAISRLVQRIWDDAQLYEIIMTMWAGRYHNGNRNPYPPELVERHALEHPTKSSIDINMCWIEAVMTTSDYSLHVEQTFDENSKSVPPSLSGLGLYELPSFCNHACLPTGDRAVTGGLMIVRASQCLRAGDEVTLSYTSYHLTYEERENRSAHWGFRCDCHLCRAERIDGEAARGERRRLAVNAKTVLDGFYDMIILPETTESGCDHLLERLQELLDKTEKTYTDCEDWRRCAIKPELLQIVQMIQSLMWISMIKFKPSVTTYEKMIIVEMRTLEVTGLMIRDNAKRLLGPCPSEMVPFDSQRSYLLQAHCGRSVKCCLRISHCMLKLDQNGWAKVWVNGAKWVHTMYFGDSMKLFQRRFAEVINQLEVNKLI